jgi:hypothetical protein
VEFRYRLTGTGSAEAQLADGRSSADVTASYLSDALGNLLAAVLLLLDGAAEARCSWDEEPGENRWVFERAGADVHLRILTFRGRRKPGSDQAGTVAFETTQPLAVMARAIADGAEAVVAEYGEQGYLDRWLLHPFPSAQLAMIRARLAQEAPGQP